MGYERVHSLSKYVLANGLYIIICDYMETNFPPDFHMTFSWFPDDFQMISRSPDDFQLDQQEIKSITCQIKQEEVDMLVTYM